MNRILHQQPRIALQELHQNTSTASQIESLSRLHGCRKTLIDHAEELVFDMQLYIPDDGLQIGTLHQLEGKRLHGALCTQIIVFADSHAVFTDLSNGIVVTVDAIGRRSVSSFGVVR